MSVIVPASSLHFDRSATETFTRSADSGREVTCIFCRNCGTRIVHQPQYETPVVNVRAGTLDEARELEPIAHTWLRSKQSWVEIPGGALSYETQPTTQAFLTDLERRGISFRAAPSP